jgi:NitT/TauT family transport system substrate-binding protein
MAAQVTPSRRRRGAAVGMTAVLALTATACGSSDDGEGAEAGGLTEIVFAQPTPQSIIMWPSYMADELGYFEEEGIRIKLAPASEEIPLPVMVQSGDADVAAPGASEVLFATREGADLQVVFDWWTLAAEGTVTPADSDIQGIADLAGERVGLASDEDRAFLAAELGSVGLSPDDVDTVVVGGGAGAIDALKKNKVAAYSGATSDFAVLQAAGIELRNITAEELAETPAGSFVVSPTFLEEQRDLVVGFCRAYAKATYAGRSNPEALQAMSEQVVPEEWRDENVGQGLLEVMLENVAPDDDERIGDVREDVWAAAQDQLLAVGELEEPQDLDAILNDELIEEINDFDRAEVDQELQDWVDAQ